MTSIHLNVYRSDAGTALAQRALVDIKTAPVLRLSSTTPNVAEIIPPVELSNIHHNEIVELTHYSRIRSLATIRHKGQCNWSTGLGVSFAGAAKVTGEQSPQDYRALYLIRVHAPSWPEEGENFRQISSGTVGKECMLAFTVAQGQYVEIPVKVSPAGDLLVPDP